MEETKEKTAEPVKLTKTALNKFIRWSSSRYNDYLCFGTKAENVKRIYQSLVNGCYVSFRGVLDKDKTVFKVECAGANGENGNGRHWRIKGGSDNYIIDCTARTITAEYSKRTIAFKK